MKCPNCGSTAQPKVVETEYIENGWDLEAVHTYQCSCGCLFTGTTYYHCEDCDEYIEKLPKRF